MWQPFSRELLVKNAIFNYGQLQRYMMEKTSEELGYWGGGGRRWEQWGWSGEDVRTWQPRAWILWIDFKTDDLHADLVICAFQCSLNTSFLLLISRSSFGLFFSFIHKEPPPPPPSHEKHWGIIVGYVQRSTLTFNPSLSDRRGPSPLPEHKGC